MLKIFQLYGQYTRDLGNFARFQATQSGASSYDVADGRKKNRFRWKHLNKIQTFLR